MPTEATFVESLKKYITRWCPTAHFYRPNDARTSGVPDLFVFAQSRVFVIEAKCPSNPPRDHGAPWLQHDFSPLQVAFLKKVWQNGSTAVGLINVLSTGECWLIPGDMISIRLSYDRVRAMGVPVSIELNDPHLWLELLRSYGRKAEKE